MSDQQIEQMIQEKGLNAPRVTPQRIEDVIASEHYFTAGQGVSGEVSSRDEQPYQFCYESSLDLLTFCVLVLKNGFTVTGESACASPENFDPEVGRKAARQNAVNKIWALEGYLLKQALHEAAQ
ncbi:Gp49 family protein [Aeromonas caviae]